MKIELVDNWREALCWFSTNCMILATALQGAWLYIPEDLKERVPEPAVHIITIGLLVAGVVGRLIKQKVKCRVSNRAKSSKQ